MCLLICEAFQLSSIRLFSSYFYYFLARKIILFVNLAQSDNGYGEPTVGNYENYPTKPYQVRDSTATIYHVLNDSVAYFFSFFNQFLV